ncbi:response regulator transcription factor [Novosphingobium sp.]|jgi:DNA-binding NarL/FixJ family response regulator|uniref:response regulator transcription factor n=1 Tax=Novosphingobium sp. TaxID=1874826 RepID=UPI002FE2C49A
MREDKIRIVVADDHPLIRRGVRAVLSMISDVHVIGEAEDGGQAVELYRTLLPDLILLDLQMPNVDGIEAIAQIRQDFPQAKILVLTTYSGDAQALRALRAGALGYILKSNLHDELIEAIHSVHEGREFLSAEIMSQIARHQGNQQLTDRERSVLILAAAGNSNKRIASSLEISEETVKGYMKIILSKLDAVDRTHAVTIALRRGMIEL